MPITVSYGSNQQILLITPAAFLLPNMTYTVTLTGVTDMVGNMLASPYSWSFTTGASTSLTQPVPTFSPANGTTLVSRNPSITITFNKPINPLSVDFTNYVFLYSGGVIPTTATFSPDYMTITLTPVSQLSAFTTYYIYSYYVQDLAGNGSGGYTSSFTTGP